MDTIRVKLDNQFEAELYTNILDEESIPHVLITNNSLAYNGIFELTMGWGFVDIPIEYEKKALMLYKALKESFNKEDI
ncbi:MAG TPA: hypothetical protein DCG34_06800 [Clostridiales bacterium]|jgi:hypothetical protein|nr:hypothetical protein [Clostridiales bacterium]